MGERDELIIGLNHADSSWLILGANGIACRSVHISFVQRKDQIDTVNKSSTYPVIEKPFAFIGTLDDEIVSFQ
jgi:hypothetical protein